jgi:hydroxymethylbilane synthase
MLKIATRDSDLALWQARHVERLLVERSGRQVELVPFKTKGDLDIETPLAALEGKGFFTKELEAALLAGEADLAVHSLKDLPTELPPGLKVAAVLARADRRDALLMRPGKRAPRKPLPLVSGAVLGTSSARRLAQAALAAPDLEIVDLRGNVPTRVRKLRDGKYDAILLAWAGLERLGLDLSDLDVELLDLEEMLPAPGQGALAIEIRADDAATEAAVAPLDDPRVRREIEAERGLLRLFAGGCKLPLGVFSEVNGQVNLRALYAARDAGGRYESFRAHVTADLPEQAARRAFDLLLEQKTKWAQRVRPLSGKTVVVTRPADQVEELRLSVESMGGSLRPIPTLAFEPAGDEERIAEAVASLHEFDWILFTSANAVHYFFESCLRGRSLPAGLPIGAVGRATARAVEKAGATVALTGEGGTGGDLAELFLSRVGPGKRVLWPAAESHRPELATTLHAAGVEIVPLVIYRSTLPPAEARLDFSAGRADWILVTSPQAGRNFVEMYGRPDGAAWAAIGPTTQTEMQKLLRIPVTVAREASLEALAEVLV